MLLPRYFMKIPLGTAVRRLCYQLPAACASQPLAICLFRACRFTITFASAYRARARVDVADTPLFAAVSPLYGIGVKDARCCLASAMARGMPACRRQYRLPSRFSLIFFRRCAQRVYMPQPSARRSQIQMDESAFMVRQVPIRGIRRLHFFYCRVFYAGAYYMALEVRALLYHERLSIGEKSTELRRDYHISFSDIYVAAFLALFRRARYSEAYMPALRAHMPQSTQCARHAIDCYNHAC